MKISEVQIEFIKPNNGLIRFASPVINNSTYVSSIAIHRKLNTEGYRLTYPSKGKFPVFHPINRDTSFAIKGQSWAS